MIGGGGVVVIGVVIGGVTRGVVGFVTIILSHEHVGL